MSARLLLAYTHPTCISSNQLEENEEEEEAADSSSSSRSSFFILFLDMIAVLCKLGNLTLFSVRVFFLFFFLKKPSEPMKMDGWIDGGSGGTFNPRVDPFPMSTRVYIYM